MNFCIFYIPRYPSGISKIKKYNFVFCLYLFQIKIANRVVCEIGENKQELKKIDDKQDKKLNEFLNKNKVFNMVKTETDLSLSSKFVDCQTQFGNNRVLEQSDCIFMFKDTESDYEEPPSDNEDVSFS